MLYYQTNNIRLKKEDDAEVYWLQIEDDEVQKLDRNTFIEKYVKPSTFYISQNFTIILGTERMIDNFIELCKERFNDNLNL